MNIWAEQVRFRGWTRSACAVAVLALSAGVLAGCDELLEVELPAQLGDNAVADPAGAQTLRNSVIGQFEQGWNRKVWDSHGREAACEVILQSPGVEDPCAYDDVIDPDLYDPMTISLAFTRELHDRLSSDENWAGVPGRQAMLGIASLYAGGVMEVFAEHLCEITVNGGQLMTPAQAYSEAESLLTRAISEVQSAGDFELPFGITSSALQAAYGLRSRVRWANGNLSGALADANQVPEGFVAWVGRDPGPRRNLSAHHGPIIGYAKLYGIVDFWNSGGTTNPATGQAWPEFLPFTGYRHLGILPDGRAVRDDGLAIRTADATDTHIPGIEPTAVADTRVPFIPGVIQGSSEDTFLHNKWTSEADDLPWINWKEIALIAAEAEGGQAAIDHVNRVRTADDLPLVRYADPGNAEQIRYMILEERRRALFIEGRYYASELLNLDVSWFPRGIGNNQEKKEDFGGAVKHLMPDAEYELNPNITLDDRATGCKAEWRPLV